MDTIHIAYVFDPLCGWCYGASPVLAELAARPGFAVKLVPTGLFAGENARKMDAPFAAFAWSNDQRIGRLTGQPFSEAYRGQVLANHGRPFDSAPATLALTAVTMTDAGREINALKAIQHARYVEGRDTTDLGVLATVLRGLGLGPAADRLGAPDESLLAAYRQRLEEGRAMMRRFGIDGVPALVVGEGEDRRALPAGMILGGLDGLLGSLRCA